MEKIKKYLFGIVMMLVSINVFAQEEPFTGDWQGANKEGDLSVTLTLNCDGNWQLNPYNENARCNGFMEVNMSEPSGRQSLLSTYEFYVENMNGNEVILSFVGGRPDVDTGISGQCKVVCKDDKLYFSGLDKGGKDAAFNGLTLVKAGSGEEAIVDAATDDGIPLGQKILAIFQIILSSAIVLFVIGHMGYVWYKGARYKEVFTVENMVSKRVAAGMSEKMTDGEIEEAWRLMDEAFAIWTVIEKTGDDEFRKPTKMKQIKQSAFLIDQVIAMQPTDEAVIERLNALTDVINSGEERHFDGSKKLVWLGVIVGILMYWMMGVGMMVSTLVATGLYIVASRTPQFLIDKRALRGGGNIHNGIFAGLFGLLAGAQTVRTIYKFNDGHKEYSDDHSQHWIALAITGVVMFVLAMMMTVWVFLNYLRNYVLYF